ncbi:MAG: hypothetical protein JJV99_07095 [Colwellia sp.]|nr:hypothetical protein [Colwellia sp.]
MVKKAEVKKEVLELNIKYSIEDKKLKTDVNYPHNFLSLCDQEKVQLLSGLIDVLNKLEVPETPNITKNSINEAHDELVQETILFPFGSSIKMDITDRQQIEIDFVHDDKIASLHPMHSVVLLDQIIKVLKAMAIMIIRKNDLAERK